MGQTFGSVEQAFKDAKWTQFPNGGCSWWFEKCRREESEMIGEDHFEPCDPRFYEAGLPEFYFSTIDCLPVDLQSKFVKEACKYWGRDQLTERELKILTQGETREIP